MFAEFLAVLPHRRERGRAAAAERPGNAREVAWFRGELDKKMPVPGRARHEGFCLSRGEQSRTDSVVSKPGHFCVTRC